MIGPIKRAAAYDAFNLDTQPLYLLRTEGARGALEPMGRLAHCFQVSMAAPIEHPLELLNGLIGEQISQFAEQRSIFLQSGDGGCVDNAGFNSVHGQYLACNLPLPGSVAPRAQGRRHDPSQRLTTH